MSSHAFYIACSYLALAVGLTWEIWDLRRQRRRVIERARQGADESEQEDGEAVGRAGDERALLTPHQETLG